MRVNNLIALAAIATAVSSLLAGRAQAGPPYVTDDPEPVPYQHFEFYNLSLGTAIRGDTQGEGPAWEYNYGIIPNGQAHIIAPLTFDTQAGSYGYGDTELGFKYRVVDEDKNDWRPMVGVYPLVELPTGNVDRGLGAGYVRAYFPLWIQKSFGEWTTYGGGGYWINPGNDNKNWGYLGCVVQRKMTKTLTLGAEVFFETPRAAGGTSNTVLNVGGGYDLNDTYHLIWSAGHTVQGASAFDYFLGLQITFGPKEESK